MLLAAYRQLRRGPQCCSGGATPGAPRWPAAAPAHEGRLGTHRWPAAGLAGERRPGEPSVTRSVLRAGTARERAARWLQQQGLPGLVLTRPGPVSWLTGGLPPPVDRSAATDLVWAVLPGESATLITTEVEADRIAEEYQPGSHGFAELMAVPWYDPDAFVRAAAEVAGAPASALASDGHPAFGADSSDDLTALRLTLSVAEQEDLRALGADAAAALEEALTPGRPASVTWTSRPGWPRPWKPVGRMPRS